MVNNIDILEEKEKRALENVKSLLLYSSEHEYFSPFKEEEIDDMNIVLNLVENLISENKELKKENDLLKSKLNIWENLKNEDFIPKSKVEELKDKIHRELEINAVTRRDLIYVDLNLARIDKYFNDFLRKE